MEAILIALLKNAIIPEVLAVYRAHKNLGVEPTSEQILAALDLSVARITSAGQAFLDATRMPVGTEGQLERKP